MTIQIFRNILTSILWITIFVVAAFIVDEHMGGRLFGWMGVTDTQLNLALAEAIVIYLLVEQSAIFKPIEMGIGDIRRRIHQAEAVYCSTLTETYGAIAAAIYEVSAGPVSERTISLAAMHGYGESRDREPRGFEPATEAFDKALAFAVTKRNFQIRELFNINDPERLAMVVGRLEQRDATSESEVKVISISDALPLLAPLVIGEEHVFLALADSRYNRVARAIHLRGKAYADFAKRYFDELWNDERATSIRKSATGLDYPVIDGLRKKVTAASSGSP